MKSPYFQLLATASDFSLYSWSFEGQAAVLGMSSLSSALRVRKCGHSVSPACPACARVRVQVFKSGAKEPHNRPQEPLTNSLQRRSYHLAPHRSLQESGHQGKPQLFPCQDGCTALCLIPNRDNFTGTYVQCYFARIMMNGRPVSPSTCLRAHIKNHCNFSYMVLIPFEKLSTKTEKKTNNFVQSCNIILTCLLYF